MRMVPFLLLGLRFRPRPGGGLGGQDCRRAKEDAAARAARARQRTPLGGESSVAFLGKKHLERATGAPGIATRSKDATRGSWLCY